MAVAKRIKERLGHEMQPDTLEPTLTVSAITAMPGCRKLRKIGVAGLRLTSKELVRTYRAVLHYFVRLRCACVPWHVRGARGGILPSVSSRRLALFAVGTRRPGMPAAGMLNTGGP